MRVLGVVVAAAVVALVLWASYQDAAQWKAYKEKFHCRIVAVKSSQMTPVSTIDMNGNVGMGLMTIPAQTAWKCDDGVTYWR